MFTRDELLKMVGPAAKEKILAQIKSSDNDRLARATAAGPAPKGRQRIRSKPIYIDNIRFASTFEGNYYSFLKLRVKTGEITRFHRQIIFDIGGGRRLVIDFMVIYPDGRIEYVETKGYAMEDYRIKKDICEDLYKIKITEIRLNRS